MVEPSTIGLTVAGWLASNWMAYRWGLRSQSEAEKRKARIAALARVDQVIIDAGKANFLETILTNTRKEMGDAVFIFSSRFKGKKRQRIELAGAAYSAIAKWDVSHQKPRNLEGAANMQAARAAMIEPLQKLRAQIEKA